MRLVYLGSPEMAVGPLRALVAAGHEVVLVVTNPPRRRGRRSAPEPTPVGAAAAELGLAVTHDPDDILSTEADLGVVVAFGRIIRPHVLERLPMVNLHFSLLPRWRGAAPVERALLAGDTETGVCLMEVEEGLDTGAVHAREVVPIRPGTSAAELRDELVEVGTRMLVEALAEPLGEPEPQPEDGVTYAEKITPDELELRWDHPVEELLRTVAVGGAWTTLDGRRIKVLQARAVDADASTQAGATDHPGQMMGKVVLCSNGALELELLQPEGKSPMDAQAFLNGARIGPGTRLGT